MVRLKRCLCLVLALALLLTWPGFLPQKAEAVAVADDATVLSLALLFTTWAGVTFNQSDQAVTAMKSFLSTKTASAASLAGLIAKNLVVEGTKLLITGDVRSAFGAVLPEIRGFFNTESEVLSSKSSYFVGTSVAGPAYSVPIYRCVNWTDDFLSSIPPLFPSGSSCVFLTSSWWSSCFFIGPNYVQSCSKFVDGQPYGSVKTLFHFDSGLTVANVYFPASDYYHASFVYIKDGKYCTYGLGSNETKDIGISFRLVTSSDSATYFDKSPTVNGSSVSSSLDSTDLDTANASISIAPVTSVVSSGVAGSTAAPGLSAEDYERILADVLASTAVIPTTPQPTTAEPEPTTATPDEDKVIPITPDILGGLFDGLKGWVEPLLQSILAAIQAIPEKIDSLFESLTAWWTQTIADIKAWCTQVIADVKAWIEVKIQTIADWWTIFWSETKALILSISAAITEFFTVTFPAWITDVKEWAVTLPRTISDAIAVALTAVFIPAAGYWDAKVVALQAAFPLFNAIILSANSLRGFFQGLGSRPPIIYIDLGNSASWAMGGKTIFLDLTWYSQYKPTMDTVLSAFLWIFALWRIFLRLPGLIRGGVGDWGSGTVADEKGSSTDSSTDLTVQR